MRQYQLNIGGYKGQGWWVERSFVKRKRPLYPPPLYPLLVGIKAVGIKDGNRYVWLIA